MTFFDTKFVYEFHPHISPFSPVVTLCLCLVMLLDGYIFVCLRPTHGSSIVTHTRVVQCACEGGVWSINSWSRHAQEAEWTIGSLFFSFNRPPAKWFVCFGNLLNINADLFAPALNEVEKSLRRLLK